jgi:hypothetical protein
VADRGYFNGEEIKACDDAGITVTLPKPMTCDLGRVKNVQNRSGNRMSDDGNDPVSPTALA